jgi:glycosyltransferase involved in cell wall biosynthesis
VKIILVPYCYTPDLIGGTEVYVSILARNLHHRGEKVLIAAPGERTCSYVIDEIPVRRFATSNSLTLSQLYGPGDPKATAEFEKIVDEEQPDIVHLHAFTAAVSISLLRAVKSRRIPIVFTYHTPTVSCARGTMMRWGSEICDGALRITACSACTLHGLGVHRLIAGGLSKVPSGAGAILERSGLQSAPWTALEMTHLLKIRHASFRSLLLEADHIVAVCDWVRDVLLLNSVSTDKLSVSRQGIERDKISILKPRQEAPGSQLNISFFGRLDATKGLHLLIKAFGLLPQLKMKLDVFGVAQTKANLNYKDDMIVLANGDQRIIFREPVSSENVASVMCNYDAVAVPSQWLETGPLVVLEAFAAGVPIIGSNLGGIAELVRNGEDGLLVDYASEESWAEALRRLASDSRLRRKLQLGVRPPRTGRDVASDMIDLYRHYTL